MENFELKWIKVYTEKVAHEGGKLSALSNKERHHFSLLIRKYEIEQQSEQFDDDMAQSKMPL